MLTFNLKKYNIVISITYSAAHLALSSVLSSMGGSVLFEGCPDDDIDLVWRGRVELIAVDGVLPDTSVKLETEAEYR